MGNSVSFLRRKNRPASLLESIRTQVDDLLRTAVTCKKSQALQSFKRSLSASVFNSMKIALELRKDKYQETIESYSVSLYKVTHELLEQKTELYKVLSMHQHNALEEQGKVTALQSNIDLFIFKVLAQTYIFEMTTLKALDPKENEWNAAVLQNIINDGDDVDWYRQFLKNKSVYTTQFEEFQSLCQENQKLIDSVTTLINFLDSSLSECASHHKIQSSSYTMS